MELKQILQQRLGDWYNELGEERVLQTLSKPIQYLTQRRKEVLVEPQSNDVLKAFELTQFKDIKVVVVGMDPYPTKSVANGIAFSCSNDIPTPKSLKFIHKAIEETVYGGFKIDCVNDLSYLCEQGVLMLNSALTVEVGEPGSHINIWKDFISLVVKTISLNHNNIPFILLGSEAKKFERYIDNSKHLVLKASHPASAVYTGNKWDCNNVFSQCSNYLENNGKERIQW